MCFIFVTIFLMVVWRVGGIKVSCWCDLCCVCVVFIFLVSGSVISVSFLSCSWSAGSSEVCVVSFLIVLSRCVSICGSWVW